ncbi:Major tail protein V [Escherichia coli]|uniref:Major tail protein V n=1 Tax=Escherichia coli TaxID=562 RepID=A0A376YGJ2_ECOLX|nr:Major tail protein V [Escherichia coli]
MPGEQGQQALLAWFNEGDTRAYKIRFPNGTVDVFRGWVSSIGKAVTAKEVITRTVKVTNVGRPSMAERSQHGNSGHRHDGNASQCFRSERAEHDADRGIPSRKAQPTRASRAVSADKTKATVSVSGMTITGERRCCRQGQHSGCIR